MAAKKSRKTTGKTKKTGTRRAASSRTKKPASRTRAAEDSFSDISQDTDLTRDICMIILMFGMAFLMLAEFDMAGPVGRVFAAIMFGLFGWMAYVMPLCILFGVIFYLSYRKKHRGSKLAAGAFLLLDFSMLCELTMGRAYKLRDYSTSAVFEIGRNSRTGGGLIGGTLTWLLTHYAGFAGTVLILIVVMLICAVVLSRKSFAYVFRGLRTGAGRLGRAAGKRRRAIRERMEAMAEEDEDLEDEEDSEEEEDMYFDEEEAEEELPVPVVRPSSVRPDDFYLDDEDPEPVPEPRKKGRKPVRSHPIEILPDPDAGDGSDPEPAAPADTPASAEMLPPFGPPVETRLPEPPKLPADRPARPLSEEDRARAASISVKRDTETPGRTPSGSIRRRDLFGHGYVYPKLRLLTRPDTSKAADTNKELQETALRLQETLKIFGVSVTIEGISQGPAVTRYELRPEVGVKVNQITSLANDIQLSLAAENIRIQAPIPGKSVIGIEVPNRTIQTVYMRDMLSSKEFRDSKAVLPFVVGKDIAGERIVADLARMPHMLVAGQTGSGKSVFINTLIVSLLFRCSPEEVKFLMIDPKVVELKVYDGIPHLMAPVITEARKAATALNWAVSEMENRFRMFAAVGVRDISGYNALARDYADSGFDTEVQPMHSLVVIIDELSDLMITSKAEVESSIIRLAQLARAAGIHLVIATQRPTVNVVTGLIKANMPSKVAFRVANNTDSRTILDQNGAERLLGNGDMLFLPQGFSGPERVQGAFLSDAEVAAVVEAVIRDNPVPVSQAQEDEIDRFAEGDSPRAEHDEYFVEAGYSVVRSRKGTIGNLQRLFKIGFNRAARIMDELAEAGVVSGENGTKSRDVIMDEAQYEAYLKREGLA